MEKREIILSGKKITYFAKQSRRAKRIRITIKHGGTVILTMPCKVSESRAVAFMASRASWILKYIGCAGNQNQNLLDFLGKEQYKRLKNFAYQFIAARISKINKIYNFQYKGIAVKNQTSRWGSCSSCGNLNFNYRICLLPDYAADYVIAHELCHLKEFNHSPRFWSLVAVAVPNYVKIRERMRKMNLSGFGGSMA